MIVKTEFASVEENDGSIRQAIERRAYKLYEHDGFKDGSDQYHWFRAEKELTIQDPALVTAICCAWFRYLSRSTRLALPANSMEATLY